MPKRGNGKEGTPPLILSEKDLRILTFLAKTHCALAEHVAAALFSAGSVTTVRSRLSTLAGGGDFVPNAVLLRVPVPSRNGNPRRAYRVGALGAQILATERGVSVSTRRPSGIISYAQLRHSLAVSGLYAALLRWDRGSPALRLKACKLSYELSGNPKLPVVPDLFFTVEGEGGTKARWIEVDASTQWRQAFTRRLNERLAYIPSEAYAAAFGKVRPLVCYLALGETPEAGERRAETLARWALSACKDLGKEHLARRLRFTSMMLETVLTTGLLDKEVWFRGDAPATPETLFPSSGSFREGSGQ